jgi:hypothetical protein
MGKENFAQLTRRERLVRRQQELRNFISREEMVIFDASEMATYMRAFDAANSFTAVNPSYIKDDTDTAALESSSREVFLDFRVEKIHSTGEFLGRGASKNFDPVVEQAPSEFRETLTFRPDGKLDKNLRHSRAGNIVASLKRKAKKRTI